VAQARWRSPHETLLRCQPISGRLEQQKDALRLRDDVRREANEWASDDVRFVRKRTLSRVP
jgi:hypothetical protein